MPRRLVLVTHVLLVFVMSYPAGNSGAQETAPDAGKREARLIAAAVERTTHLIRYDGSYRAIEYPGGDVPDSIGVCADLVVRSYRAIGIDLQEKVHEDMAAAFDFYPAMWALKKPDPNIDHRRVPNLKVFFGRHGTKLPISRDPADYRPGDIVTWILPGNLPHIGLLCYQRSADGKRPLVVHNIGEGPRVEDVLFSFRITGHYRYGLE